MMGDDVITKAFGALLQDGLGFQQNVLTYDQFMVESQSQDFHADKLELNTFHQLSCVSGSVGDDDKSGSPEENMNIFVKTFTGKIIPIQCSPTTTIDQLKMKIEAIEGISPEEIRLSFFGHEVGLDDNLTLDDYEITDQSTVHLILGRRYGPSVAHYIPKELLSPAYDFDFTGIVDVKPYTRGSLPYKRPCGWKRFGLNVLDKYENNVWLGAHRERNPPTSSVADEWPVSYHGTGKQNSSSIAEAGYLLSKGQRFRFGTGIYSTPEIDIAELYASKFTHKSNEYLAVVQNRVNPKTLIRIPPSTTGVGGEYWVTPTQEDIRPYGICIKQVRQSDSEESEPEESDPDESESEWPESDSEMRFDLSDISQENSAS